MPRAIKAFDQDASECDKRFVIKYRPDVEDVNWAREGVVATVRNGESLLEQNVFYITSSKVLITPSIAEDQKSKATANSNEFEGIGCLFFEKR